MSLSEDIRKLGTERQNAASAGLDTRSSIEIATIINNEDMKVARAVKKALPQIARAIDCIADALAGGGRLIYVGAGTSGRIAALDASEMPPTFNTNPKLVQYVIAGGNKALAAAAEANEDVRELGERDLACRRPTKKDVIVGIAASGRTPYTQAALQYARTKGARTIAVVCNTGSPLARVAEIAIEVVVGPEVVSGSTRMKAGTAQKMILNMLSTGAMVRLGYVYDNLMVNLHLKNSKLMERGLTIIQRATGCDRAAAKAALKTSGNSVSVALIMMKAGVTRAEAARRLATSSGNLRQAIGE